MQIHLFDLQNLSITQYPFTLVAFTPFLKDFQLTSCQRQQKSSIHLIFKFIKITKLARNSAILLPTCEVKCSEGTCGLMTVYTSSTIIWHSTWDRTKNKLVKECYTGAICYEGEFVWSGVRPYASILVYWHLVCVGTLLAQTLICWIPKSRPLQYDS